MGVCCAGSATSVSQNKQILNQLLHIFTAILPQTWKWTNRQESENLCKRGSEPTTHPEGNLAQHGSGRDLQVSWERGGARPNLWGVHVYLISVIFSLNNHGNKFRNIASVASKIVGERVYIMTCLCISPLLRSSGATNSPMNCWNKVGCKSRS